MIKAGEVPTSHWSIMRIDGADHLVDCAPDDLLERESSRVIDFDAGCRVVTTGSGRRYVLVDAPGASADTRRLFSLWCRRHGLHENEAEDVSHEY